MMVERNLCSLMTMAAEEVNKLLVFVQVPTLAVPSARKLDNDIKYQGIC